MEREHRTKIKDRSEERKAEHHDFGCIDERGRAIGGHVFTGVHEFVEIPDSEQGVCAYYGRAPGRYLYFQPQATRNGNGYGPTQDHNYFTSEAERAAAIAKYLDGAKKRAVKKSRDRIVKRRAS